MKSSKVFISYTHDSDLHRNRVLELSERLRSDGVDSNLDQYERSPAEGWAAWTQRQIKEADFVLLICTEHYVKRYEGSEERGKGSGAKWEGAIIRQELYEADGKNSKFIPIVFTHEEAKYIPVEMRRGTYYVLDSDARYDDLYGHLTDQPKTVKRELGSLRALASVKAEKAVTSASPEAARVVTAEQAVSANVPETPTEGSSIITPAFTGAGYPLMVLAQPGRTELFVRAKQIKARGKLLSVSLLPSDPRQVAAINNLARGSREPIGIAYNHTALFARLKTIEQIIEKEELWHLEFEEDEYATKGSSIQFSMVGGYSVDQLAEMRARRILLNEELDGLSIVMTDYNKQLLDKSIEGGYDSKFAVSHSPLPALYSQFIGKPDEFTEAARPLLTLLLLLTHTVSQVLRLDLDLRSDGILHVNFEGGRQPVYSNEKPVVIRVIGTCDLDG